MVSDHQAAQAPFDIVRVAHVELYVRDLEASERFYVDQLGLVVGARTGDALYLRGWEERVQHSLTLRRAGFPAAARPSFRVRGEHDLEQLAMAFERQGLTLQWAERGDPGLGRRLRAWDPFGYPLLLHRRPGSPAIALVGDRSPLSHILGYGRSGQLVRGVLAGARTGRCGGRDRAGIRRRARGAQRGDGVAAPARVTAGSLGPTRTNNQINDHI